MKEVEYYNKAKEYLLSFDLITNDILNEHLNEWQNRSPKSMNALFKV